MTAERPNSARSSSTRPGSKRSAAAPARISQSNRPSRGSLGNNLRDHKNALAMAMLGACLVLGGGGTSNPGTEMLLELLLPLLIVTAIWWPRHSRTTAAQETDAPISRAVLVITGIVLVIPVAQLIPLPPAIWHALPGREPEVSALALINQAGRWMPFTMTPASTFASGLAILAELAVFVCLTRIDVLGRRAVCRVIAGVAIVSIVLGCLQISMFGGLTWSLYGEASDGWVLGFQANRNAETDVLQVGVMALAAVIAGMAQQRDHLRVSTVMVLVLLMIGLALGAVLTGSRTGAALLPLTYLFVVWILWPFIAARLSRVPWRKSISWVIFLLPPAACLLLAQTEQVQHALNRFNESGEHRWDIWHDTITAIRSVWPLGGGIGSFPVIYDASQSIERLSPLLDTRAHNDWLEWVLESGVPGIIVLTLIGIILLLCAIRALGQALRRGADVDYRATVIFATGTLLHIGLHGLFDYPMRSMALAALVGTAVAMLMPSPAIPE
jgi:O-antigen ligase